MRKEYKNEILKNPWVVGIGTAILSVFLLKIFDIIASTTILLSLWNIIKRSFNFLLNFFLQQYESPLWFLLLLFVTGILALLGLLYILSMFEKQNNTSKTPPFSNYISDNFEGILYKWTYYINNNKYTITNLTPYCPKDNCIIYQDACPICKASYYNIKEDSELEILIQHRIENKMYVQT
ncbi:hypothetical protein ACHRV6_02365 [Flavobacterium sp. FlaQc-51]|uniref:hypothetical protein n=1 Tax=Flavobacterium sp. FlaQc-51 TaxID=3374184 RepID=UPI003757DA2B